MLTVSEMVNYSAPQTPVAGFAMGGEWERDGKDMGEEMEGKVQGLVPAGLLGSIYVCCWLRGTVVERWSLTGELSLSCARPAADG